MRKLRSQFVWRKEQQPVEDTNVVPARNESQGRRERSPSPPPPQLSKGHSRGHNTLSPIINRMFHRTPHSTREPMFPLVLLGVVFLSVLIYLASGSASSESPPDNSWRRRHRYRRDSIESKSPPPYTVSSLISDVVSEATSAVEMMPLGGSKGGVSRPPLKVFVYNLPGSIKTQPLSKTSPVGLYSLQAVFLDALLKSEYYTEDPEEASLFHVPVRDRDGAWGNTSDPERFTRAVIKAIAHVKAEGPFWDRNKGRDHIFAVPRDVGPCEVSNTLLQALGQSLTLVHWGGGYSIERVWRKGCFDLRTRVVVPPPLPQSSLDTVAKYSPFFNTEWKSACMIQSDSCAPLMYFSGTICWPPIPMRRNKRSPAVTPAGEPCARDRYAGGPWYSGNVRKMTYDRFRRNNHLEIVDTNQVMGYVDKGYGCSMSHACYCLAPTGTGFAIRPVEAVLLGCVPVLISESDAPYLYPFEPHTLHWDEFSLKLSKADIPRLQSLLAWNMDLGMRGVMRTRLADVWSRMVWRDSLPEHLAEKLKGQPDAFETTMLALQQVYEYAQNNPPQPPAEDQFFSNEYTDIMRDRERIIFPMKDTRTNRTEPSERPRASSTPIESPPISSSASSKLDTTEIAMQQTKIGLQNQSETEKNQASAAVLPNHESGDLSQDSWKSPGNRSRPIAKPVLVNTPIESPMARARNQTLSRILDASRGRRSNARDRTNSTSASSVGTARASSTRARGATTTTARGVSRTASHP